jgi:lipopolysaccharide/colanic/teichoic acid biosynthesis glycosyltransferase
VSARGSAVAESPEAPRADQAREHIVKTLGGAVSVQNGSLAVDGTPRASHGRAAAVAKRSFDVVAASLALLVLSPLVLVCSLAILVGSGRPLIFHQRRVGLDGLAFDLLKFRTMVRGAEERSEDLMPQSVAGGMLKLHDDPRTTRVGSLIRRFYIDELPQLVNVIRGEMSVVGPRPMPPYMDRNIPANLRGRLDVRPGLTGPWQLLPPPRIPLEEMAVIDCVYASEWTFWKDMKIVARTIPYTLRGSGI